MASNAVAFKTYQTSDLGGQSYDIAPNSNYNVIGTRTNAQGQQMVNLDFTASGGGTGWALASAVNAPAQPAAPPATADQVQGFLNQSQQALANPQIPVRSAAEIQADYSQQLQVKDPSGNVIQRPQAPSLVQQFTQLKEAQGVNQLENGLNDLKAQEQDILARNQARTQAERQVGRGITTGVAAGRIGEIQQQEQQNLEFVQRQKARVNDQLQTAYNGIKMIMDLTQQDYQNAAQSWDAQYKQNFDMINLVQSERKFESDEAQRAFENTITLQNQARATLQVYAGLITDNGLSYNQLPTDQRLQINKLEVQAGLPAGFLSQIKAKPLAITQLDDGRTQVLTRGPNGEVQTSVYGTANPTGGVSPYQAASLSLDSQKFQYQLEKDAYNTHLSAATTIVKNASSDKYVDANEAASAYGNILNMVGGDTQAARQLYNDAFNQTGKVKYGSYTL